MTGARQARPPRGTRPVATADSAGAARTTAHAPGAPRRRAIGVERATAPVRARAIARRLGRAYPDAWCALRHRSPWELLVATVLSAQSTDAQVNRIAPYLFAALPTAAAMAAAPPEQVESLIRAVGMFHRKAAHLQALARGVRDRFDGAVPCTLDALTTLAGVGRKTANVVLGTAFGTPAITVDTHVGRLARRMGLSRASDPDVVERDLGALVPRREWIRFSHRMIDHGRQICAARRPACERCPLADLCPRVGVS
jgi:endonuclease-3